MKLTDVSPRGINGEIITTIVNLYIPRVQAEAMYKCSTFFSAVFDRLPNILRNADIEKRVQYMVEVMFAIRKDGFKVRFVILIHLVIQKMLVILQNSLIACLFRITLKS